jgi:hypothetical protein
MPVGHCEDLKGRRFGRWKALRLFSSNKHKQRRYWCVCDCGTERAVLAYGLTSGHTKSCGCLGKEERAKSRLNDITGQRFGKLTVLERAGSDRNKQATWLCLCDCGKKHVTRGRLLTRGDTTSCGCLRAPPDLTSKRFERLLVLKRHGSDRRGQAKWLCRCDCGKERVVLGSNLTNGQTRSCGCLARDGVAQRNRDKSLDLKGLRFGRLKVVNRSKSVASGHSERTRWVCVCDCGKRITTLLTHLRNGDTQSCGCMMRENLAKRMTTHGLTKHPLSTTWHNMVRRCHNPRDKNYDNYGGRGITVYERWLGHKGLQTFIADLEREIGPRPPDHTLDRIDNSAGYRPGNVRWATALEQTHNRRITKRIDEWATEHLERELSRRGEALPAVRSWREADKEPSNSKKCNEFSLTYTAEKISAHPLYKTWLGIRYRCTNPKSPQFKDYGGRGIRLHQEWIDDAAAFISYLDSELGPRPPGHSLDRIDNEKGYQPNNIRWADQRTQIYNRRPRKRLDSWSSSEIVAELRRRTELL